MSSITDAKEEDNIATLLRKTLQCSLCCDVPKNKDNILMDPQCGNILGCGMCVTKYYVEDTQRKCMFCNTEKVAERMKPLRGFEELVEKLRGKTDQVDGPAEPISEEQSDSDTLSRD